MDPTAQAARRTWAWPALATAAVILPGLAPAGAPGSAMEWLASGALQSLSQTLFLLVIIGAGRGFREYGLGAPRARDLPRAAAVFAAMFALAWLGSLAPVPGASPGWRPEAASPPPSPALFALCLAFSLAVACREELFYRIYLLSELRSRGVGAAAALLASTALFAVGHVSQGARGALSAALAGAALCLAALRGWGFGALALGHAAYDLAVLVTAFF